MLTVLEAAVLEKMLTDEHPVLRELRDQLAEARVKSREFSGIGFFTEFEWPNGVTPVAGLKSTHFSDVHAELEGLEHGAGFVLFVDDGIATMLEGHTYTGVWPKDERILSLRYEATRDFGRLNLENLLGGLKIFRDAAQRPELFVWNGVVAAGELEHWMHEASLQNAPLALVDVWRQTGGGELFETETILGPGTGDLEPSLEERNKFLRGKGLPDTHIVFYEGSWLFAFRRADGIIVQLDDHFGEIHSYASFDHWYRSTVHAEFAQRYGLIES